HVFLLYSVFPEACLADGASGRAIGMRVERRRMMATRAPFLTTPYSGYLHNQGFCRKVRFLDKIQKLGVRNSMTYRLRNSPKSNFATEPHDPPRCAHRRVDYHEF